MPDNRKEPETNVSEIYPLIKDFVDRQDRLEDERRRAASISAEQTGKLEAKLNGGHNAILRSLDTWGKSLRDEFRKDLKKTNDRLDVVEEEARLAHELGSENRIAIHNVSNRVDTLEVERKQAERRKEFLASVSATSIRPPPWELGKVSDTGTHKIVSILEAEASQVEWDRKLDAALETRVQADKAQKWDNVIKRFFATGGAIIVALTIAYLTAVIVQKK
jgi:hypothetical protein